MEYRGSGPAMGLAIACAEAEDAVEAILQGAAGLRQLSRWVAQDAGCHGPRARADCFHCGLRFGCGNAIDLLLIGTGSGADYINSVKARVLEQLPACKTY